MLTLRFSNFTVHFPIFIVAELEKLIASGSEKESNFTAAIEKLRVDNRSLTTKLNTATKELEKLQLESKAVSIERDNMARIQAK